MRIRRWAERFLAVDHELTGFLAVVLLHGLVMLGAMVIDPRTLDGHNVWLKPAKFAASLAVLLLSVFWFLEPVRSKQVRRWLSRWSIFTATLIMSILTFQAARQTRSHFNFDTWVNGTLYLGMGLLITLAVITVPVTVYWCARIDGYDRERDWAARCATVVFILGCAVGLSMAIPRAEQVSRYEAGVGHEFGDHAIGASDPTSELPVFHWSREGGDLRPAHAVGLHAVQVIPLLSHLVGRARRRGKLSHQQARHMISTISAAYGSFFTLVLGQAWSGQPLVPCAVGFVAAAAAICLAAVVTLALIAWRGQPRFSRLAHRS